MSQVLSPRTIITGQTLDYNHHCVYQFGEYVQTHEQHNNSMEARTIGALAMRPTGNVQGSYYFYSLSSGRIINRRNATKLPMPADVIDRVEMMAIQNMSNPGLMFTNRNHDMIEDVENMVYYDHHGTDDYPHDVEEDMDHHFEVAQDVIAHRAEITGVQDILGDQGHLNPDHEDSGDELSDEDNESILSHEIERNIDPVAQEDEEDEELDEVAHALDEKYGPRTSGYNLRPRRERNYDHLFVKYGVPFTTAQMNMKQGIAMFGMAGIREM